MIERTKRQGGLMKMAVVALLGVLALPLGLSAAEDRTQFEQTLQANFPGSYKLYVGLDAEAKTQVYREYKKTDANDGMARFSAVIAKILQLSINRQ